MTDPYIVTCSHTDCPQQLWANNPETEGYCPEHSGNRGHGKEYARKDHMHEFWERVDYRVRNNTVNQR